MIVDEIIRKDRHIQDVFGQPVIYTPALGGPGFEIQAVPDDVEEPYRDAPGPNMRFSVMLDDFVAAGAAPPVRGDMIEDANSTLYVVSEVDNPDRYGISAVLLVRKTT